MEAERKMGDLLKGTERNVGAKGSIVTSDGRIPVKDDTPTLAELGLSKRESVEAKLMASLPEEKQVALVDIY